MPARREPFRSGSLPVWRFCYFAILVWNLTRRKPAGYALVMPAAPAAAPAPTAVAPVAPRHVGAPPPNAPSAGICAGVIAFTYRSRDMAAKKAKQINSRWPDLRAAVFAPKEVLRILSGCIGRCDEPGRGDAAATQSTQPGTGVGGIPTCRTIRISETTGRHEGSNIIIPAGRCDTIVAMVSRRTFLTSASVATASAMAQSRGGRKPNDTPFFLADDLGLQRSRLSGRDGSEDPQHRRSGGFRRAIHKLVCRRTGVRTLARRAADRTVSPALRRSG